MNHLLNLVISTYSFVKLPKANDEYNTSVFRANVGWFWNFGQACSGWQFVQLCDKPQNTSTLDGTHAPIFGKILDSKKRKSEHHQSLDIFHLWNIYLYGRSLKYMIDYWVTLLHHTWFWSSKSKERRRCSDTLPSLSAILVNLPSSNQTRLLREITYKRRDLSGKST